MDFITNLENIMKQKGITAYKLEKDTGIKQTTIQGWKRGSQPSLDKIQILISYLNVSADDIIQNKHTNSILSDQEQKLLEYYRTAPQIEKEIINKLAKIDNNCLLSNSKSAG